jgi:MFS family permease
MALAAHFAPDQGVPGYRRITVSVGLAMFIDASLYLAVLPLLPHYAHEFGFGTLGAALLIAAYPAAVPAVALGSMVLVPRFGARTIALASAVLMTAATVGFAFAPGAWALVLSRFLQGVASGTIWTASMAWVTDNAPPDRRGRESGIVMGMLSAGSIAGPFVGALAAWIGTRDAFLLVAVASGATVVLTWVAPLGRPVIREHELLQSMRRVVNHPLARAGIAVALIDPLAFGTIDVLVPLHLGDMGVATTALAAAFAIGAALGSLAGPPAGRLVDRVGAPRVALIAAVLVAVTPLLFALITSSHGQLALLALASPVFAVVGAAMFPLASAGADETGVAHVVVNGVLGATWAIAFTIVPLAAGALAHLTSDTAAFLVASVACVPLLVPLARAVRDRPVPAGTR